MDTSKGEYTRAHCRSFCAAVLGTHFIGEEKRLVGVLNAIDPSEGLTGLTR